MAIDASSAVIRASAAMTESPFPAPFPAPITELFGTRLPVVVAGGRLADAGDVAAASRAGITAQGVMA